MIVRPINTATAVASAAFASFATADTVSIEYSLPYSGATTPAGARPWLTATFEDTKGEFGEAVLVTLSTSGLTNQEYLSSVFFNFRESIDPGSVRVSDVSRENFLGTADFRLGRQDDQNAGGGYRFDLEVDLPNSGRERLAGSGVYAFLLETERGLNIYDLLVTTLSDSKEESLSVAHVQALSDGSSVWISAGSKFGDVPAVGAIEVPEPSTYGAAVVSAGMAFVPIWRRWRKRG